MNTWTYWEDVGLDGPSAFYQLCFESMRRNAPNFQMFGPVDVLDLDQEVFHLADGLPVPQRSDLFRLRWLFEYGGVWTDSDCVQTAPWDFMDDIPNHDLIGVLSSKRNGLLSTPFAAPPRSPAIGRMLEWCIHELGKMKSGIHVPYGLTSVGLLSRLWKEKETNIQVRNHWKYNRVPWYDARKVFNFATRRDTHEYGSAWSPIAQSYHFTHVITKPNKDATREGILKSGRKRFPFYSFLFQKALGLSPAIFGRTQGVLNNLPQKGPVRGVEIGSWEGRNARNLLQQRRDLHLTLVDPWQVAGNDYRSTNDYQTHLDKRKIDQAFKRCKNAVGFAGDRVRIFRQTSKEAFGNVKGKSLDFVFIDGNHSLQGVMDDLDWWIKVKPGGFICGHDYNQPKNRNGRYGVNRAVNEFAARKKLEVETGTDYFWLIRL